MTIVDIDTKRREAIEAEARAWVVRLDGGAPAPADLAALREWTGRSPQHFAALREMAEIWGALDALAALRPLADETSDAPATNAAPQPADAGPVHAAARPRRFAGRFAAAAAVALVCAGALAAYTLWPAAEPTGPALYATARSEQTLVTLPDGSEAQLNTESLLEVGFERDLRRLRLVRGEALFQVASDPARPFIVYADNGSIRALGTVFTVRVNPDWLEVAVTEGSVELTAQAARGGATTVLAAGHAAIMANGAITVRSADESEMERLTAWSRGVLIFDGDRLADVLAEVNRYSALHIDILDPELRDLRIGGRFRTGETEALLDALQNGFGLDVTREGDLVLLSRSDRT